MVNIIKILIVFELILNGFVGQMTIGSTLLLTEIDSRILMSVFCLFALTPAYLTFTWKQHEDWH